MMTWSAFVILFLVVNGYTKEIARFPTSNQIVWSNGCKVNLKIL